MYYWWLRLSARAKNGNIRKRECTYEIDRYSSTSLTHLSLKFQPDSPTNGGSSNTTNGSEKQAILEQSSASQSTVNLSIPLNLVNAGCSNGGRQESSLMILPNVQLDLELEKALSEVNLLERL